MAMMKRQIVHCPNCGCLAERNYHSINSQIQTECLSCDYLMVMCADTGRVVESYAPGIYPHRLRHSGLSVKLLTKLRQTRTLS